MILPATHVSTRTKARPALIACPPARCPSSGQHENALPRRLHAAPTRARRAGRRASLIRPKGNTPERQAAAWILIKRLTSAELAAGWSRFNGYFARQSLPITPPT